MEELRLDFDEMRTQWQDDHDELQRLRAAPPAPTVVVQRERKLRRYSGMDEPALDEWIEEAQAIMSAQHLEGEAAASFVISYLDGAARSEIRCQPNDVRKDVNSRSLQPSMKFMGKRRRPTNYYVGSFSVDRWLASPSLRIRMGWWRLRTG